MTKAARLTALFSAALLLGTLVCACGNDSTTASRPSAAGTPTERASASPTRVPSTPTLDSIVVLGHSGTTGYGSDPSNPGGDVRENSWATGSNPAVDSIYRRLLATHPALKGHATSLGVDGSKVDDLVAQTEKMLALDPLPDVVIIQTIDNDIRCDGTDPQNYGPFAETLDGVLTTIQSEDRNAQVFLVAQWASVQTYADAIAGKADLMNANAGNGRCDLFTPSPGKERPQAIRYLQSVVDAYYARVQQVCARHRACFTDDSALRGMRLRDGDLTGDGNHLSVQGLANMASVAWAALPDAIKNRA